ncbi:hypothetical protein [Azospirillum sp. SYSU D00513]|uniref:hypothetical protein n=1 Tax=Azospirillum sp. SYSU D00513 TaxID=2812561 RepID=UPI001A971A65|nr:hypothetical protein [Azospirillum sp. SYSU D00513]
MSRDDKKPGIERRALLKGLGLGTAGAIGAVAAVNAAAPPEPQAETPEEQLKARYRETDHVKRYYALNRL